MEQNFLQEQRRERMRLLNLGKPAPSRLALGEAARNNLIYRYRHGAEKRNLVFELDIAECENLFQQNCFYCGKEPSSIFNGKSFHGTYTYNGIDRKDNEQGYVSTNVVSCCGECNMKKGEMGYVEFLEHIFRIHKHAKTQR